MIYYVRENSLVGSIVKAPRICKQLQQHIHCLALLFFVCYLPNDTTMVFLFVVKVETHVLL
jgi:hypothetical protein